MAVVRGDIRVLLCGERTALNYLQRMSGIATYTNGVAKLLAGTKTKLLDTRKTSPNNRIFEKYAVRIGGGNNHRYNLTDGVLLKDNHIGAAGGVKQAVTMAKEYAPFVRKIEVEVENLSMVREAVEAGADIIMLDNMSHEDMREAMNIIGGKALVEVSGNVTKENIAKITDLGVDFVSSGALTHSAPIMDISLKIFILYRSNHCRGEPGSCSNEWRREKKSDSRYIKTFVKSCARHTACTDIRCKQAGYSAGYSTYPREEYRCFLN